MPEDATEAGTEYRVTLHRDGRKWFALLTYSRPGDTAGVGVLLGIDSYVADGRRWYRFGRYSSRSALRAIRRAYTAADRLTKYEARQRRDALTFEEEFATPKDRPYVGTGPR